MMRSKVRGFKVQNHLIPVQFEFGKTTFSEKGKKSASQLAECLKQRQRNDGLSKVELSTTGRGEKEPLQLENADNYTQEEIYELNRRVANYYSIGKMQ